MGMGMGTRVRLSCLAAIAALALTLAPATAFADDYCDIDPGMAIHTPGGNNVVVHINAGGPTSHLSQLASASRTYSVAPADNGAATAVTLSVLVADNDGTAYAVNSSAWTGANRTGTLYSQTSGIAGQPMVHRFQLNVP